MAANILLVDDEPFNLQVLSVYLRSAHYETIEATNGAEAIDMVKRHRPDLILLDVMMPGMSGYEVSRKLNEDPTFNAPVIFLSANAQKESMMTALLSGGFDYLTKPYDFEFLIKKIEIALRHRRQTQLMNQDTIISCIESLKKTHENVGVYCIKLDEFHMIRALIEESGASVEQYVMRGLRTLFGDKVNIFYHEENCVVLCMPLERRDESLKFAETINQYFFSQPLRTLKDDEFYISVSTGVSVYPLHTEGAAEMLKMAKTAVAFAGKVGRNTYRMYEESIDRVVHDKMKMESALHKAIEKKELLLHYQPKVDINNDELVGVEALVRWNSSEFGVVSPLAFIPLAEDNGLIIPIGEWILNTACAEIHSFNQRNNKHVSVAVNVSTRQFINNDMVASVQSALSASGLAAEMLELEITESALVHNNVQVLTALERIRQMGVKVSIDDFGTGYSSLSYLKEYPVDTLKIDRSFIQNITDGAKNIEIVSTIISLGHNLHMKVVAEGVETLGQIEALRNSHCDIIQGYIISKPMPMDDFDVYIR